MINISRTSVPTSWLAPPPPYKSTKQSDFATRISVSTINTDIFPELITWAAAIENQSPTSCLQKVPVDVLSKREVEVEITNQKKPTRAPSAVLDPISIAFGFDQSCLEGLDDSLMYSPVEAFEELCWMQATHCGPDSERSPRSTLKNFRRYTEPQSPADGSESSGEDTDTDSDDYTFNDERHHDLPANVEKDDLELDLDPMGDFLTYKNGKTLHYSDEERTSFIFFDSGLPAADLQNCVGSFPIPTQSRKTVPRRIAAFCANIPGSLAFMKSQ